MNKKTHKDNLEFSVLEMLQVIYNRKRIVIRFLIVFAIVGVLVAMVSQAEYSASTSFISQVSSEKNIGKKISGIAALVGVNLGGSGENVILPSQYPLILESTPFKRKLLDSKISTKERDSMVTVSTYLSDIRKKPVLGVVKEYTIGLPGKVLGIFKKEEEEQGFGAIKTVDSTVYHISKKEKQLLGFLYDHISLEINDVEGFIEIKTTFPEAVAAAQLANNIQNLLQSFIIEFNITKANQELAYIEQRYKEAEKDYFEKRAALARFKDRNINMVSNLAQSRLEQLQTEYSLSSNIYSQLAGELESARLKIKKDTPVFTILKPATIPLEPSAPKKVLVLLQFIIVGIIFGSIFVLAKFYYPFLMSKLQN